MTPAVAPATAPVSSLARYHFTRPRGNAGGPFDPNGTIFFNGRYHLGYLDEDGGKWFWGHVSSADLLQWQLHPPTLTRSPEDLISSGSAFLDRSGRVVLCYDGRANYSPRFAGGACLSAPSTLITDAQPELTDPLRPQFHYTAPRGVLSDPNGLLCYQG